jgi:hypothetical protein
LAGILEEKADSNNSISSSIKTTTNDSEDPMPYFMYALKAPETRRQWPRRLKIAFDFIMDLSSKSLEEQAREFVLKTRNNPKWAENSLIKFLNFQRGRAIKKEISEATIPNYYKAVKLFCEMNDLLSLINWKKIPCGLPRARQAANDRAPTIEELEKL